VVRWHRKYWTRTDRDLNELSPFLPLCEGLILHNTSAVLRR
jgi:hypothetical protein